MSQPAPLGPTKWMISIGTAGRNELEQLDAFARNQWTISSEYTHCPQGGSLPLDSTYDSNSMLSMS